MIKKHMRERKRIAIILKSIGIANRGAETFFIELTQYLSQYYDIDVYSMGIAEEIKEHIIQVPCEMGHFLASYSKLYSRLPILSWFLNRSRHFVFLQPSAFYNRKFTKKVYHSYIKNQKYALLFPGGGSHGMRFLMKYRKLHNAPFIYAGEGGIGPGDWQVLRCRPDTYICLSSLQLKWAKQYWSRVCLIPNGTYIANFQKELKSDREGFYIQKNHRLVIAVGHLDIDFKRHQLTIEAVSRLSDVDLLILGRGDAKKIFEDLASEKMPGRCVIKEVPHEETPYYYKSADVFTLASLGEPFGIVYIEAMAAGLPVVTTDDTVRREIVGDAGLFCNVEDPEEYAEALAKALSCGWQDKPQKKAAQYDYSVIGEKYHTLIDSLIQEHPYHEKEK